MNFKMHRTPKRLANSEGEPEADTERDTDNTLTFSPSPHLSEVSLPVSSCLPPLGGGRSRLAWRMNSVMQRRAMLSVLSYVKSTHWKWRKSSTIARPTKPCRSRMYREQGTSVFPGGGHRPGHRDIYRTHTHPMVSIGHRLRA